MTPDPRPDVADLIRDLEQQRYDALQQPDLPRLDALLHNRLAYIHSTGTVERKPDLLTKIRTGHYQYRRIEHRIEEVILAEPTAIVLQQVRTDLIVDGQPRHLSTRTLTVWVDDDSQWQLIAHQPVSV